MRVFLVDTGQSLCPLQQLVDGADVVREQLLVHQPEYGRLELHENSKGGGEGVPTLEHEHVPVLNNELKEPEEVKEEAGLVGYQEVEQDTRVAAHDADELDETSRRGGVKQALIISTRYVEGNMCIEQTQKALHKGIILLL